MTLKLKTAERQEAEVFFFRFDGLGAWATFTLCEATGELSIQSDWGAYSYSWTARGEGVSLKQFLARTNADYVLGKFKMNGAADLDSVVDERATKTAIRKAIDEWASEVLSRKPQKLIASQKLIALEMLNQLEWAVKNPHEWLIINVTENESDLWNCIGEEPHNLICDRPSPRWAFIENELWPFWTEWLRGYLFAQALSNALQKLGQ